MGLYSSAPPGGVVLCMTWGRFLVRPIPQIGPNYLELDPGLAAALLTEVSNFNRLLMFRFVSEAEGTGLYVFRYTVAEPRDKNFSDI